ncbi:unnamed protein product [Cuscuta epithymum]|uniref:Bidirectional sugar transporter SWEET n=1 Tax=Cuscuta epithymum TaxID=186058 RepID=A0AAV0F9X4_9ASTE|nr:unnamed protein product [Cuscuta epithymum]
MLPVDTARFIIGIIGNVISLVLFLSPLPAIVKIWSERKVAHFSSAPYLATFINCGLWLVYGTPIIHPKGLLVMTINGAGVAIEVVFLFVFFFCSDKRKRLELGVAILVEVIFFAALVALVITLAHTWETRSAVVGGIAALASIVMYASPLASMKLVITTKSVEYMPLSLSVCSLVNSLCWSLYALMRMEIFILAPNGIGVLLGLAQILLYAKYYKSSKGVERKRVLVEVGSEVGLTQGNKKPMSEA